jgi:cytidylate kinase
VVFPDANVKIYLDADPETRIRRRHQELVRRGLPVQVTDVAEDLKRRDDRDRSRTDSPLVAAGDAVPLNTSGMTVDEQVAAVLALVRTHPRFPRPPGEEAENRPEGPMGD